LFGVIISKIDRRGNLSFDSGLSGNKRDNVILFIIFCAGVFFLFLSTTGIWKDFGFFPLGGFLIYFAAVGYVMVNGSALNSRISLRKLGVLLLIIGAMPIIWYLYKNDGTSSLGLIGTLIYGFGAVMIFAKKI
jgi:hypothetical protein